MSGAVSLTMSHEPGFFDSLKVEGFAHQVLVSESEGRLTGVAVTARRQVYLNGTPTEIGYLGHLRIDRSARGASILAQGFRFFKKLHETDPSAPPFYLCSILNGNSFQIHHSKVKRKNFPEIRKAGTLYTAAIPLLKRKTIPSPDLDLLRGDQFHPHTIAEFLNSTGQTKQFYPVYTEKDLDGRSGLLHGLALKDFHIACKNGRIVGAMACWDQSQFRRIQVADYSRGMRWAKAILSPIFQAMKLPGLPDRGCPLSCVLATAIAIEDNAPRVFEILLNSILRSQFGSGNTFLLVGLMEDDPLLPVVRKYCHFPTRSSIHALSWEGLESLTALDKRGRYVELGSL